MYCYSKNEQALSSIKLYRKMKVILFTLRNIMHHACKFYEVRSVPKCTRKQLFKKRYFHIFILGKKKHTRQKYVSTKLVSLSCVLSCNALDTTI